MRSFHSLPPALEPYKDQPRWVVWRLETKNNKPTKVPYQARQPRKWASTRDPSTWADFNTALATYQAGNVDGIGICLLNSDLVAFDLDHCRNAETGAIVPTAQRLIEQANSYVEITPSETGVRIIGTGTGPEVHRKQAVSNGNGMTVETYRRATRYITVTGNVLPNTSMQLANMDALIDETVARLEGPGTPEDGGHHARQDEDELARTIADGGERRHGATRSEAVWYVINEMLRRTWDEQAMETVLLDRSNRISDHIYDQSDPVAYVRRQIAQAKEQFRARGLEDFVAYLPEHKYIYQPTRDAWPAASVDVCVPKVRLGKKLIAASRWLDINRGVDQMTWTPGLPMDIKDKLIAEGEGWIERKGSTVLNIYRPPTLVPVAGPVDIWLDHMHRLWGQEAADNHIIPYFAHCVQRPDEKINHALVLEGRPGIGKDTILEPLKQAVGPWNFGEASPEELLGTWTDFLKSIVLRINEARDLGDSSRFAFYDHTKRIMAAPPNTLRVNVKYIRQFLIPNIVRVIITTNYKDALYLPADDRRHYVIWSDCEKEDFAQDYWDQFWGWYDNGGLAAVAHYLRSLDISGFNAKAPPPKTEAFWEIVNSSRAPEDAQLADALDRMGRPQVVTLMQVLEICDMEFGQWLRDKQNTRRIPHRFEECGYVPVRNPYANDGLWKIGDRRQVVYGLREISEAERVRLADGIRVMTFQERIDLVKRMEKSMKPEE
jgi:hypothetical protein